jgi:hypothetical protein
MHWRQFLSTRHLGAMAGNLAWWHSVFRVNFQNCMNLGVFYEA